MNIGDLWSKPILCQKSDRDHHLQKSENVS